MISREETELERAALDAANAARRLVDALDAAPDFPDVADERSRARARLNELEDLAGRAVRHADDVGTWRKFQS